MIKCINHFFNSRLDNDVFDEDGNSLSDLAFGTDQIAIRSPPSLTDDLYTLYYPPEKRYIISHHFAVCFMRIDVIMFSLCCSAMSVPFVSQLFSFAFFCYCCC